MEVYFLRVFFILIVEIIVVIPIIADPLQDKEDDESDAKFYSKMMDETSTLSDMWRLLDCDKEHAGTLPIHNESTWSILRGSYIGSVGYENSSLRYDRLYGNGFVGTDAIEVKHHPLKGRAVYAKKSYKKGDEVYRDTYSACFEEGPLYRKFLASIPPYLACDVFEWAYSGQSYGACVDLDEGSFINHASNSDSKNRDWELGNERPNLLGGHIASRDIQVGEELLTDYSEFAELDGWEELGLGGWDEEDDEEEEEEDGKENNSEL